MLVGFNPPKKIWMTHCINGRKLTTGTPPRDIESVSPIADLVKGMHSHSDLGKPNAIFICVIRIQYDATLQLHSVVPQGILPYNCRPFFRYHSIDPTSCSGCVSFTYRAVIENVQTMSFLKFSIDLVALACPIAALSMDGALLKLRPFNVDALHISQENPNRADKQSADFAMSHAHLSDPRWASLCRRRKRRLQENGLQWHHDTSATGTYLQEEGTGERSSFWHVLSPQMYASALLLALAVTTSLYKIYTFRSGKCVNVALWLFLHVSNNLRTCSLGVHSYPPRARQRWLQQNGVGRFRYRIPPKSSGTVKRNLSKSSYIVPATSVIRCCTSHIVRAASVIHQVL